MSSEISAIYLFSGNKWEVKVDGKYCPFNDSDIQPYKFRYVFSPPNVKIGKNGWSQIEIIAQRVLGQAWKGDVLKDKYTLAGRALLRVETADGNIDHEFEFNLEVTSDEIPF